MLDGATMPECDDEAAVLPAVLGVLLLCTLDTAGFKLLERSIYQSFGAAMSEKLDEEGIRGTSNEDQKPGALISCFTEPAQNALKVDYQNGFVDSDEDSNSPTGHEGASDEEEDTDIEDM